MRPDFSREDYRDLLRRFHGYYHPLEQDLLNAGHWRDIGLDYPQRLKTAALERDLVTLGDAAPSLLPQCSSLPDVSPLPASLGCLYVLEGATLGGQIISRHLREHLGLTPATGAAFFSGYGPDTGPRWKEFGTVLTTAAREEDGDAIVAAANQTFMTLSDWIFADARIPHESL